MEAMVTIAAAGDVHASEATRARRENLVLMSSEYEQPFGTFTGTLEDLELREGYGVMERHAVAW